MARLLGELEEKIELPWRLSTVTIIDVPAVGIIRGKNLGTER
jgi:hypothetical protein